MDEVGRVGRIGQNGAFSDTYTYRLKMAFENEPTAMGRGLALKLRGS